MRNMTNSEPRSLFALSQKLRPRDGGELAPPPLSITYRSERKRAIYDFRHFLQTMSLMISCIVFALVITINISCTASRRQKAPDVITSNRGGGIDQCPISQTRAVHRHKRSYKYCCYSCCLASHWILVPNTFEGVVMNYRRAVD